MWLEQPPDELSPTRPQDPTLYGWPLRQLPMGASAVAFAWVLMPIAGTLPTCRWHSRAPSAWGPKPRHPLQQSALAVGRAPFEQGTSQHLGGGCSICPHVTNPANSPVHPSMSFCALAPGSRAPSAHPLQATHREPVSVPGHYAGTHVSAHSRVLHVSLRSTQHSRPGLRLLPGAAGGWGAVPQISTLPCGLSAP